MLTREENERLSSVSAGTPVGELLRRYWHPIAAASELALNETKFVKILGEELVLFKDRQGRLGLIGAYCAHRRANLAYGIAEDDGLTCPYHGWKFDRGGKCIAQPFEETVRPDSTAKDKVQLPAYSVQELGGLIFAYLGPKPEPLLPPWDLLVEENVWREIGYTVTPCNWLQTVENILDPVHVEWLHGVFPNYAAEHSGRMERRRKRIRHLKIAFDLAEYGIIKRRLLVGETEEADDWKIGHWLVFPNIQKGPDMLRFRVPADDTQTAQWYFSIHPLRDGETQRPEEIPLYEMPSPLLNDRGQPEWHLLDGDVDIQDNAIFASQGVLYDRAQETIGDSDRGVIMYRHLLDGQIMIMEAGKDPMNVFRDLDKNQCLKLPTESREHFLTGRLGARSRYSTKYRSLLPGRAPLP
ncbi:MAG: Rieske 2Fe-2S domain-containing protein [Deltaproteobacteria bacterium]|nr:Rieske 2Fe-2S domain-containing protein [Deltaproteobacteria bacterium]